MKMLNDDIEDDDISIDPTVESIKKIIGEEKWLQLSADLGGAWLYISANPGDANPLSVSIGVEAARTLGKHYGGHRFAVPVKDGRRARVLNHLANNVPVTQIARLEHVSLGFVRSIKNKKDKNNHPDLFKP